MIAAIAAESCFGSEYFMLPFFTDLVLELISDPFHGPYIVQLKFFTDLPYVNVDGPVAYDDITAPYPGKYFFPWKYFIGFGSKQGQQFEFLLWDTF